MNNDKKNSKKEKDAEKPRVVVKNTADLQRLRLEKLMKNPDKPVIIPERPKERSMTSAPDFVRNVMGSSAGAGSGEFHVYRHLRRKEYARQKFIQEKSRREQLDDQFHQKLEENKRKAEEKTSKKRAKRLKKKQKAKNKPKKPKLEVNEKKESEEESDEDSEEENEDESEQKIQDDDTKDGSLETKDKDSNVEVENTILDKNAGAENVTQNKDEEEPVNDKSENVSKDVETSAPVQ